MFEDHGDFSSSRRLSTSANEDDYDYALELRADDEYRQAAEHLYNITDFEDCENYLESLLTEQDEERQEQDRDEEREDEEGKSEKYPLEAESKQLAPSLTRVSNEGNSSESGLSSYIFGSSPAVGRRSKYKDSDGEDEDEEVSPSAATSSPSVRNRSNSAAKMAGTGWSDMDLSGVEAGEAATTLATEGKKGSRNSNSSSSHRRRSTSYGSRGGAAKMRRSPSRGSSSHADGDSDEETHLTPAEAKDVVSRSQLRSRLGLLQMQRKWAISAARRSSADSLQRYAITDKAVRDAFLVALASGVRVRRHQGHKSSEIVYLSSPDGCRTLRWAPKVQGSGKETPDEAVASAERGGLLQGLWDSMFGLDEDLLPVANSHVAAAKSTDAPQTSLWRNMGFRRSGSLLDTDVVAIHAASREDPTALGMLGTEQLRASADIYKPQLTFSVIVRSTLGFRGRGYTTLDIECEAEETYLLLFHGFRLLHDDAAVRQAEGLKTLSAEVRTRLEALAALWGSARCLAASLVRPLEEHNPVDALFNAKSADLGGSVYSPSSKRLPPAQFLGWKSAGTQIWARLKMAGLQVKCVFSWDLSRVILKVRCPQWRLEEMAEIMHLRLKNRDGSIKRFKVSRRDTFIDGSACGALFRSSERQQIIDHIIRLKIKDGGAGLDEDTPLGRSIVQRFPLHMHARLDSIRHVWVTFWREEAAGTVAAPWSPFSTPAEETMRRMGAGMDRFLTRLLSQPLDSISEYYGESVAFYFAFLSYYTRWLVIPSALGLVVFAFQVRDLRLDHWTCIPYSISVMVWACFMLAFWRQKSSLLAYRWGVLDFETEESERPQFRGKRVYDELTGEVTKVFPIWRKVLKYLCSIPILLLTLLLTLVIMSTVFTTQDRLFSEYSTGQQLEYYPSISLASHTLGTKSGPANATSTAVASRQWSIHIPKSELLNPAFWSVTFLYPCLYGVLVDVMVQLFQRLAVWLTDFENHRTRTTFMNRLVLKVFSFRFITVFTSLFFYAFSSADTEAAYLRLSVTIFALLTVGQWSGALLDICLPSLYHRLLLYRMRINVSAANKKIYKAKAFRDDTDDLEKGLTAQPVAKGPPGAAKRGSAAMTLAIDRRAKYLDQAKSACWEEALNLRYTMFGDYTSLIVQMCLVVFFSPVFPLAPLIAFLNNLILVRLSAYKLCYTRQRPIAVKISGIGVWEDVLQIMSVLGIITSCLILGLTSATTRTLFGAFGAVGLAVGLFSLEHVLLFFKYWLHSSIPRVPLCISRAQSRDRRGASRKQKVAAASRSSRSDRNHDGDWANEYAAMGALGKEDDDDEECGDGLDAAEALQASQDEEATDNVHFEEEGEGKGGEGEGKEEVRGIVVGVTVAAPPALDTVSSTSSARGSMVCVTLDAPECGCESTGIATTGLAGMGVLAASTKVVLGTVVAATSANLAPDPAEAAAPVPAPTLPLPKTEIKKGVRFAGSANLILLPSPVGRDDEEASSSSGSDSSSDSDSGSDGDGDSDSEGGSGQQARGRDSMSHRFPFAPAPTPAPAPAAPVGDEDSFLARLTAMATLATAAAVTKPPPSVSTPAPATSPLVRANFAGRIPIAAVAGESEGPALLCPITPLAPPASNPYQALLSPGSLLSQAKGTADSTAAASGAKGSLALETKLRTIERYLSPAKVRSAEAPAAISAPLTSATKPRSAKEATGPASTTLPRPALTRSKTTTDAPAPAGRNSPRRRRDDENVPAANTNANANAKPSTPAASIRYAGLAKKSATATSGSAGSSTAPPATVQGDALAAKRTATASNPFLFAVGKE